MIKNGPPQGGMPNRARIQPSWAQRNEPVIYEEPEPNESPAITDSVGSGATPASLMNPPLSSQKKARAYKEMSCCEKLFVGGCLGNTVPTNTHPALLAAGSQVQQGGIILMGNGAIAIFPEYMPEMEDCFYAGVGVVHAAMSGLFIVLAVCSLAFGCNMRFSFSGIWCGAPVLATAVFSFIVAKKEARKDVKKLVICVSLAFFTSIIFAAIAYLSATVDGVYYKWTDIKDDQKFKSRAYVDAISMVVGPLEAILCLGHFSSLISNLNDECTYRCCPRRKFRRYLKDEAKREESVEVHHLKRKKELMQKLILDLEEEENYKDKWRTEQDKLLKIKEKEKEAWSGGH